MADDTNLLVCAISVCQLSEVQAGPEVPSGQVAEAGEATRKIPPMREIDNTAAVRFLVIKSYNLIDENFSDFLVHQRLSTF
jgi:hypothetical protein